MRKFCIADTIVEIQGLDEKCPPYFELFECSTEEPTEVLWTVTAEEFPGFPEDLQWKDMKHIQLARNEEAIYEVFPEGPIEHIHVIQYSRDFNHITFYLYGSAQHFKEIGQENGFFCDLSIFMREAFFLKMQQKNAISLHSASIVYREHGVAFSASSGTGKSTHADLWVKHYGTPYLDGDVTVCRLIDGKPYIYGLPWAGTSGLMENRRVPLAAIVFLQRSEEPYVERPNPLQTMQRLMVGNFNATWYRDLHRQQIQNTQNLIQAHQGFYILGCNISKDTVDCIKQEIDQYLDQRMDGKCVVSTEF